MRFLFLALPLLLVSPEAAPAQATIDLNALDQLQGGSTAPAAPGSPAQAPARKPPAAGKKPLHPPPIRKPAPRPPATPKPGHPAAPVTPPATPPVTPPVAPAPPQPAATIAPAPPPVPVLPPALPPAPVHPPPAPAPAPIAADAGTAVGPIGGGLRITFPRDRSELTPATEQALRDFAGSRAGPAGPEFNVLAYATGVPEDPSTPRRLSLSRALAARAVLLAAGVQSTRIYVRALGASAPDGPPDRVDVIAGAGGARPAPTPSAPSGRPAAPAP